MSDIAAVSGLSFERTEPSTSSTRPAPGADAPRASRPSDRVELSDRARLLSRLAALPIRQDLVDRVRRELAAGTYETDEKLQAVVEALGEELDG
jgi:negative regulator of flagellin synthesis FlgM